MLIHGIYYRVNQYNNNIGFRIRYEEIEVDYLDSNFNKKHDKYTGFTAQIIQHEIDHCNGVVI